MLPYRINWVAASTSYLAALQAPVANIPLTWKASNIINTVPVKVSETVPNTLYSAAVPPKAIMPQDNVRTVTLTSAGNLSAVNFVISGVTESGLTISQTLAGPNANTVSFTLPAFEVFSITPSASSATTVSVGISGGYTMPYQNDVWNKQSLLSFEISNTVGTISLTPQMTNDLAARIVNTIYTPQTQTWYALPPDQTTVTPPITADTMFSFREFPVNSTRMLVGATTTGTFTLTTLMQGAKF